MLLMGILLQVVGVVINRIVKIGVALVAVLIAINFFLAVVLTIESVRSSGARHWPDCRGEQNQAVSREAELRDVSTLSVRSRSACSFDGALAARAQIASAALLIARPPAH